MSQSTSHSPIRDPSLNASDNDTILHIPGAYPQEEPEENESAGASSARDESAPQEHEADDLPPAYHTNPPSPIQREYIKGYRGEFPPDRQIHDYFEEEWFGRSQTEFVSLGRNPPAGVIKVLAERVWIYPDYDLTIFHPCVEDELVNCGLNGRVLANLRRHLRWRNHEQAQDDTRDELLARYNTTLALDKVIRLDTSRAYYHEDDDKYDELESSEAWWRLSEVDR